MSSNGSFRQRFYEKAGKETRVMAGKCLSGEIEERRVVEYLERAVSRLGAFQHVSVRIWWLDQEGISTLAVCISAISYEGGRKRITSEWIPFKLREHQRHGFRLGREATG